MDKTLSGKSAVVTGAGRGIGKAIALKLAKLGASVTLVSRTGSELEKVAQEIVSQGGKAAVATADISKPDQVKAAVAKAIEKFGQVDILVNNAGTNNLARFEEQPEEEWWEMIDVNLRGPYLFCKAVLPGMLGRKWGRIINVSSAFGKVGAPYVNAYCTAKHGLIGMTRSLAAEVSGRGVTVNAVCPGYVVSSLTDHTMEQRSKLFGVSREAVIENVKKATPIGRTIEADEVAQAVLFLVSEHAGATTGESINVSGGMVMT